MADRGQDPSLYRRRLRAELRRARESMGMTQREVADAMDWSLSKLIRIETGLVTISTNDLRALVAHYGITDPARVAGLIETARRSRGRSEWWTRYRDVVSQEMLSFLGYESSASVIRNYEPLIIPGLLQTEEYARSLFQYLRGPKDASRIEPNIRLRMERQEMLNAEDAPTTYFLIDEAAIRRVVGGEHVMRRQLLRLREMTQLPHVDVKIVPFQLGMYRGLRVPYVLFEFSDPQDGAILFLENPEGDVVVKEDISAEEEDLGIPTPAIHLEMFWELEHELSSGQSLELIDDAIARLDAAIARPGAGPIMLPVEGHQVEAAALEA